MHKFFEGYQRMTVEEILNNPEIEAVAIETEEIYLTKYVQMAAEHGKHIHMEARIKRDIINLKPDIMSILIGVNDVWHEFGDANGVDAQKY